MSRISPIVLTFAFLAGCSDQMSVEPRIVQMPNPAERQTVKSPDWTKIYKDASSSEPKTFQVFNQKDQLLHLKFFPSAWQMHDDLSLKLIDGNTLIAQTANGVAAEAATELLSIHKLGPSTPEAYLTSLIGEEFLRNPKCYLEQLEPNIWYLNVHIDEGDHKAVYQQLTHKADQCGRHAQDWHGSPTTFFVKGGIVIVVRQEAEVFGLDISSIIYENRG